MVTVLYIVVNAGYYSLPGGYCSKIFREITVSQFQGQHAP